MSYRICRTDSKDPIFILLVNLLDAELKIRDGEDHSFYNQFNGIDMLHHCVIVFDNNIPVGCGALKEFEKGVKEVKRMYVLDQYRGKGIATKTLYELETWAAEMGLKKCILETGIKQPEAIALYEKSGYQRISNYGPYEGVANSYCFEKCV